jgi:hypothetical protein
VARAGHTTREFDEIERMCVDTVRSTAALRYLAHYTGNVFNLGADTLDEPLRSSDLPPGMSLRDELCRVGRSLCFALARQDGALREARTGALIRMVLQATAGAAFCNVVVPDETLVGFALDGSDSAVSGQRLADMAMAGLVTRIRERVGLTTNNPGGWSSAEPVTGTERAAEAVTLNAHATRFTGMSDESRAVLSTCSEALDPASVHAIAYCRAGEIVFMVDCFDNDALLPFFTQITADGRRKFYLAHAREIGALAVTFGRTVHTALGGPIVRMVLDVEQGAIYYYRLRVGDYLVGVTIDQTRVSQTDDQMAHLTQTVLKMITN